MARNSPDAAHFAGIRRHDMRGCAPAAPQPRARFPPRVQAPAQIARPHAVLHLLAELVPIAPAGFSARPLERSPAVVANE
eukprot:6924693-Alexandrium_andersonii.AAC.1